MTADDTRRVELTAWLRARIEDPPGPPLGQGYQATVRRYSSPVGDVVVKSPHASFPLSLFGKAAMGRELEIYERLSEVAGVPQAYGLIDGEHLVLESIAGRSLREREFDLDDRDRFFAELLETITEMHEAGVAHGDLKRKDNVLVGPNDRPYIIDFGIACVKKQPARAWNGRQFAWIRQMDLNAWIKLKYGPSIQDLSPEDAARYRPLLLERIARWIRIPWQTLTLRRPRQRWREGRRD